MAALRGFARLSREELAAVTSKGGKTAHALGRAHQWTREEAQEAGRRGGLATKRKRTTPPAVEGTPGTTCEYCGKPEDSPNFAYHVCADRS